MTGASLGVLLGVSLAAAAPPAKARDKQAVTTVKRGHDAFEAGKYDLAARLLGGVRGQLPAIRDYVTYYAAESEFHAGRFDKARALFRELEREKKSRFAAVAPFRAADSLWEKGKGSRQAAGKEYEKLLERGALQRMRSRAAGFGAIEPDLAIGRFRLAELEEDAARAAKGSRAAALRAQAQQAFLAVNVEFPAHPLAREAARRAQDLAPANADAQNEGTLSHEQRLARAEKLADERHFEKAVAELERIPASAPESVRVERDYALGMTKYRMRQDYGGASRLLLGVVDKLSGEKAASAAFHGTRALSRVDRDDEAIVGYRKVADRFPSSRFAPEALFLSGWLELNRGRFAESLPGLEETIKRFSRHHYAKSAAWFVALAHVLLRDGKSALPALDRYQRLAGRGPEADDVARRAQYFRARALALLDRKDEARTLWRDLVERAPFSYYGLMARARLHTQGEKALPSLPKWDGKLPDTPEVRDPVVARADLLARAGLVADGGVELVRGEAEVMKRLGRERGLALLFDRYPKLQAWRRAYQLAEMHGQNALSSAPEGQARRFWEAAYPKAFAPLVEKYTQATRNPPLLLYAIMRKESAYLPTEVSYADARGLLQLLPATSAEVAKELEMAVSADELYVPAINVRLGATYIGGLARKFGGSVALAAAAYNGGPPAVMKWCDRNRGRPLDEFVELITFSQTREYVKRVLKIYARYRHLYHKADLEISLETNCNYSKAGPNY